MTQNNSYLAKTAAFTPVGGAVANWTDFERFTYGESGSEVDMLTDANAVVNGMYVDAIKGELVIDSSDINLLITVAAWSVGIQGSMVVVCGLRKGGKGFVAASDRTLTFANAQLRSKNIEAGATGASKVSLRFGVFDPAGAAALVVT